MKTFLCRLALFLGLNGLLFGAQVLSLLRLPAGNGFMAALVDKRAAAASAPTPRVLILGGSNAAFGIDSAMVEEQLGRATVNLSLHAGMGLELILASAQDRIVAGDLVILTPEYQLLAEPYHMSTEAFEALRVAPELANHDGLISNLWDQGQFGGIGFIIRRQTSEWLGYAAQPEPPYLRSGFNTKGDLILSEMSQKSPIPAVPVRLDRATLESSIAKLNAFADACRARGATVAFSYPAYARPSYLANQPVLNELCQQLERHLSMPVIHSPDAVVFDAGEFFDTEYHLLPAAKSLRTATLIHALKSQPNLLEISRKGGR